MKRFRPLMTASLTLVGLFLLDASTYVIREGQQAVITQFGRPLRVPETEAGLHLKLPLVQEVHYVDSRILTWDGYPNQIPTRDKKYILVDTTARWRVVDALKFIQTVQSERGAQGRLDAILDAVTRDTISDHNLVEAVRNTNQILNVIEAQRQASKRKLEAGEILVAEEEAITGEIEKIGVGREHLSFLIAKGAAAELSSLGIEIIDVQLRRIAYESSVEKKVYERMISERKRIAEKIRSIGKGEQAKIQGKTSRDLQRIDSEAYEKAQRIKGGADAEAIKIYAAAYSKDPEFYAFSRKVEAYRTAIREDARLLLSNGSAFFDLLQHGPVRHP